MVSAKGCGWSGEFRKSWAPKGVSVGSLAGGEYTRTLETKVKVGTMGTLALWRSEGLGNNERVELAVKYREGLKLAGSA
jgi:hypothetical protein